MRKLQVVLGLLFIFSAYTLAQKVSGVVYYVDKPVKNAKIVNSSTGEKVKTDMNGYFEIKGTHDAAITVKYKGIDTDTQYNGVDVYTDVVLIPSETKFYKLIEKSPSIEKCQLYLSNYSEGEHLDLVKATLEKQLFIAAYDHAVADFTLGGLKRYLKKYPKGKFAFKAAKTIDIVSWQKAKSEDTMEAYNNYLKDFPEGEAVSLAKQRMAMLND